ncbi:MAG: NAD-binding protein, partial [Bosea sp. (in: a-proteobacteria)]
GLSMAMGAFIAGVMLAESNFRHELEADIEPFRGVLLGLFFMAVGMSIDADVVRANWLWLLIATPGIILTKIAISATILRVSCSSWSEALRAGALLSPAGEFAFVMLPLAGGLALLTPSQTGFVTALAALTMLVGPLAAKGLETALARHAKPTETMEEDFNGANGTALVIGFGRFGQMVSQTLLTSGVDITVIDKDVERIRSAARFGFKIYYGDGTRLDVLRAAGGGRARAIVSCVDDKADAVKIAEIARAELPQARLLTRAYDRLHAIELMAHEPDVIMRETMESGLALGGATLEAFGYSAQEAKDVVDDVRRRDYIRLEAQRTEGITARQDLIKTTGVTPEPLIEPKGKAKALSPETEGVLSPAAATT